VEEAARLKASYLEEGRQAAESYRANTAQIDQHTFQIEQWRGQIQKLEQDLRAKPAAQSHEARLSDMMQRAEAAEEERVRLAIQAKALRKRLEARDYALEQQMRLDKLNAQWSALGYDAQEHDQVRRQKDELAIYEQEHAQLQAARERLAAEHEMLRLLESNLIHKQQLIAHDEAQWLKLKDEVAQLDEVNRLAADQQKQVNELQGRAAALNRQLGAARQWVEHVKYMEVALVEKKQALKSSHAERALHEELRVAFGKKGVQAMLIEAAIPEIEQEANALLAQMTDGRMMVRFETQREKVSAKKDEAATIETLDIVISDELGPRNYEMYSGGEAFRVNFAVRIALSKLLARRAGARLQTLVIDEGFGSLDASGRERLVEAINAVQDQFEKILVITHIEELRDMFPARIDIVKTGGGSSIFVN
jgi:exonuclease SbcC